MNVISFVARRLPFAALQWVRGAVESARVHHILSRTNTPPGPSTAIIDPGNVCNLRCPLCPTGLGKLEYDGSLMSFETFETALNKMPQVKAIALFNWGEPFLHPEILRFVRHAAERRIYTAIHSNFSIKKPEGFFVEVVRSGLDQLTVSVDGAKQESLEKYRIGADFELILSNLNAIQGAKKSCRSRTPRVVWKYVVNRYNEGEVEAARQMARGLGVEFLPETIGLGDDLPKVPFDGTLEDRKKRWLPRGRKYVKKRYLRELKEGEPLSESKCGQLFNSIVVNPDGYVFPCCYATGKDNVYGNILNEPLDDIWRNEKYRYSRSLFTGKPYDGSKTRTMCTVCDIFTKCPSRTS